MYVARYSFNPEYDAVRNWSAWIGVEGETPEDVALQIADVVDHPSMLTDETGERVFWEDAPEALKVEWVLDNEDIRYHEAAGKWMHVHHEGLSCWSLDAETLDEAIEEAREKDESGEIEWGGFGQCTVGNVKYVASVNDTLHIFECDYVTSE
jgi:hypothetical protein